MRKAIAWLGGMLGIALAALGAIAAVWFQGRSSSSVRKAIANRRAIERRKKIVDAIVDDVKSEQSKVKEKVEADANSSDLVGYFERLRNRRSN